MPVWHREHQYEGEHHCLGQPEGHKWRAVFKYRNQETWKTQGIWGKSYGLPHAHVLNKHKAFLEVCTIKQHSHRKKLFHSYKKALWKAQALTWAGAQAGQKLTLHHIFLHSSSINVHDCHNWCLKKLKLHHSVITGPSHLLSLCWSAFREHISFRLSPTSQSLLLHWRRHLLHSSPKVCTSEVEGHRCVNVPPNCHP